MAGSIREVAREANVSLSTVSKVLNRVPDAKFTAATRERVLAAARRVNYHPNAIARGLVRKRMDAVGLVMAYSQHSVTSDPYLGPCLDGILQVNKERRQKTVLFTEDGWEAALENLPAYCDGHCDGLLILIPRVDTALVEEIARRGDLPFVLVGDSRDDGRAVTVDVDNVAAAEAAVAHLLTLGHRRVAGFCGNHDFLSNGQRMAGYRRALAGAGIAFREDYVFPGEYHLDHGYRSMRALEERFPVGHPERPTAVFCFNDSLGRGAADALVESGVPVPGGMSLVGFDDSARATDALPRLTTVRQDVRTVGEYAARALLDCIDGLVLPGARITVPTELVLRESSAPPMASPP